MEMVEPTAKRGKKRKKKKDSLVQSKLMDFLGRNIIISSVFDKAACNLANFGSLSTLKRHHAVFFPPTFKR